MAKLPQETFQKTAHQNISTAHQKIAFALPNYNIFSNFRPTSQLLAHFLKLS